MAKKVKKVAFLTAGGLAPCLSSSIGFLIDQYTKKAPDVELIGYLDGYMGLLKGESVKVTDDVRKNALKLNDKRVKLAKLLLDFISFHTRKLTKRHFNNGLRLDLGQSKSFHQSQLGCGNRRRGLHDLYDLVDVIERDLIALVDVSSCLCLVRLCSEEVDFVVDYFCEVRVASLCENVCDSGKIVFLGDFCGVFHSSFFLSNIVFFIFYKYIIHYFLIIQIRPWM